MQGDGVIFAALFSSSGVSAGIKLPGQKTQQVMGILSRADFLQRATFHAIGESTVLPLCRGQGKPEDWAVIDIGNQIFPSFSKVRHAA